jgi:hypothetical protein
VIATAFGLFELPILVETLNSVLQVAVPRLKTGVLPNKFRKINMQTEDAFIRVTLDTTRPIELTDFLSVFTSVENQYRRALVADRPELRSEVKIYVTDLRKGSIVADLMPSAMTIFPILNGALTIDKLITRMKEVANIYLSPNSKPDQVSKTEIKDVMDGLVAIANDPNGRIDISSIEVSGGVTNVRAKMSFTAHEARLVVVNMQDHIRLIEHHEDSPHKMVMMKFYQSNLKNADLQSKSGEQVIVEAISSKPRPLVYASEHAKTHIKHEISETEGNIYRKGFYVDLSVEMSDNRIVAYKVTNFHQVIDLTD